MKMRVHQAVLDPSKAEELLAEFADSAVAPELRELLAEELELQALGAVAYGSRGWSTTMRHATKTWTTGKGVRVQDLLSLRLWSLRRVAVALFFVGLVGLSWGIWWKTHKRPPLVQQSLHTTGTIYRVVDERPVALADVAPMPFVVLPEGQFLMGSPADEKHHIDDESPQHAISVKPFELATHEVTQKQWKIVMGSGPSLCANGCGDALPVQNVSWYDAATFMNRLTDRENQSNPLGQQRNRCYDEKDWTWDRICTGYRLPTEAEWEYAARAGSTTAFDFGNDHDQLCLYGNGADLSTKKKQPEWFDCNEQCDDGNADLSPVGSYRPNAWGIFDMHGNVYEWVWDVHRPYAGSSGNDTPIKELPDMRRVLRGGSFLSDPGTMRSAYRRASNPSSHNLIMGLRCARSASDGQ
jgi:formylglycine-generating enzyme required for sulfatase activity